MRFWSQFLFGSQVMCAFPGLVPQSFLQDSSRRPGLFFPRLALVCGMMVALAAPPWTEGSASDAEISARLPWPGRTGPTQNGHVAAEDAVGLPTEWDTASGTNVRWKLALEGFGHSTPVIAHGCVWLTAAPADGKQLLVYAVDQHTGAVRHHLIVFENPDPEPLGNEVNTYASPSCVADAEAVYVHFGTYGTARLDPESSAVEWERRDIRCRHYRGPGSSPVIFRNLLVLTFDGIDRQFLTALNLETGETVWTTDRTTDYGDLDANGQPRGDGDARKAFSTPGYVDVDGETHLVSVGSRAAFGYDPVSGRELWMVRHDDFNASAPPSFFGNLAILETGTRGANLLAVRLDRTARGDITDSHVIWNRDKGNSDMAAPLVIGERVFMITSTGVATCVNVQSGEEVWKGRVDGTYTSSPITAGGLIYFCSEEGEVTVIRAADTFEIVSRNPMGECLRASPGAAAGCLYLRTLTHLYCLGE